MTDQIVEARKHKTIKHIVYEQIRNNIINGHYPPGYRLIPEHLAQELGVSSTPIREALHSLEVEGLIRITPFHGAEVTQFSMVDIVEIYHIRAALESLATRLAARNFNKENSAQISDIIKEMENALQKKDVERILEMNYMFHQFIWLVAKSPRLKDLLENLYDASQRYRHETLVNPEDFESLYGEHRLIARALMEGNADLAEKYAGEHLERTADYLLSRLETNKSAVNS